MKKKKPLTKTQHIELNGKVLNLLARLLVCTFLLAVVLFSLPRKFKDFIKELNYLFGSKIEF